MGLIRFVLPLAFIFTQFAEAQTIKDSIYSYSQHVHSSYKESLRRAEHLKIAIRSFIAEPSVMSHFIAKEAWKFAREPYGQTEVFRFYNGPIDSDEGPEGQLNSWPLDESYIDYVSTAPTAGIIGNVENYPEITKELLVSLNQFDGEKNVSTGYHAIEFLLWGQDLYVNGSGKRSHLDYVNAPHADRRAAYLYAATEILVDDLAWLEKQWRPETQNYRNDFENMDQSAALKNILSGLIYMAGDELAGERMYVAYDSQGQEDEHSCFSDMTSMDIIWNFEGIENVLKATKILDVPEIKGTSLAIRISERLVKIKSLLFSIPFPFDWAITNEKGRETILASVEELEALAADLAEASTLLKAQVDY